MKQTKGKSDENALSRLLTTDNKKSLFLATLKKCGGSVSRALKAMDQTEKVTFTHIHYWKRKDPVFRSKYKLAQVESAFLIRDALYESATGAKRQYLNKYGEIKEIKEAPNPNAINTFLKYMKPEVLDEIGFCRDSVPHEVTEIVQKPVPINILLSSPSNPPRDIMNLESANA